MPVGIESTGKVPGGRIFIGGDVCKSTGTLAERAGCRFVRIDRSGESKDSISNLKELLLLFE